MDTPQLFSSVESAALPGKPLHLAIGMFDGVHLGHRAVIEAAVQSARRSSGVAAVLTFRPHPSSLFRPDKATRLIDDSQTQAFLLGQLGVEAVITQPFVIEFARTEANAFLPWLKGKLPHLAGVYVGQNWRFGAGRRGDVPLLVESARSLGISLFSAPPVSLDGQPVNSTRIRAFLEAGDVVSANALLGYSYFAKGKVVSGKRLGRTIGFPTLNLPWDPDLRPKLGVYSVQVLGEKAGTQALPAIANYGVRPTVEQTATPQLETHLLSPCPFDAGDDITVEWRKFIRPEMKFSSIAELQKQIVRDIEVARSRV